MCVSRSPHGERGLKLNALVNRIGRVIVSLSSRRAWIEISDQIFACPSYSQVALLTESVD